MQPALQGPFRRTAVIFISVAPYKAPKLAQGRGAAFGPIQKVLKRKMHRYTDP